jgi:TonB family protein
MNRGTSVTRAAAVAVFIFHSFYATASDEKLENDLRHIYEHQLLSLRNASFGKTLSFDSSGKPTDHAIAGPWSTCGLLQAQKLRVTKDGIEIQGKRVILALRSGVDRQAATPAKLQVVPVLTDQGVRIRMQISPVNLQQVNDTLAKVFQGGQLLERVAGYWKPITNDLEAFRQSTPDAVVAELEGNRPVYLVNQGVVEQPRPIHTPDPEYTEAARHERLQGTTVLSIVVNENGFPEMLEIVRGLGEGLDLQALLAVASWRFNPAVRDGKPVAVLIKAEVRSNCSDAAYPQTHSDSGASFA